MTNARFIVPGQTYAMSGITSVCFEKIPPKRGWPVAFSLFGLFLLFTDFKALAIFLLLLGIILLVALKTKYAVTLSSASGEVRAITSSDSEFIDSVVEALNEAIVYRR